MTGELEPIKVEINGETVPIDGDARYIVYDKEIQRVRNIEHFTNYLRKHPQLVLRLIRNGQWALSLDEKVLERMYQESKVNIQFAYPKYGLKNSNGGYTFMNTFCFVPFRLLLGTSLTWLQGIAISIYGLDGFDKIKEAKEKGIEKLFS